MSLIYIKLMTDEARDYFMKNASYVEDMILNNDSNEWIYQSFPQPMFTEKKYQIEDFELLDNPKAHDPDIDFTNSIRLYEALKDLPRYILADERFWLWLHLEKFYLLTRNMTDVVKNSTITTSYLHLRGKRRTLTTFGTLSRIYFRVDLSIDETNKEDKYWLTRWAVESRERYRNLGFRTYSSRKSIVRAALKGEMRAVEANPKLDKVKDIYTKIGKYISSLGSASLLDAYSEEDIENLVFQKMNEIGKSTI